jgi:uncharacterized membrane protein
MAEPELYDVFNDAAREQLSRAIAEAEQNTSGELRLHVESRCKEDVLDRAAYIFEKLEMHKTVDRSGVLLYFALNDHKFAILGDAGINSQLSAGSWDVVRDAMLPHFKQSAYVEGLTLGLKMAGELLSTKFPRKSNDQNELSNEVSMGN